jgi:hypothetical protein
MHRQKLLVALVVAVGLGAFLGWWIFVRSAGVNRRSFDRIQTGMSQREVEAILGGPPGDYTEAGSNSFDWSCVPRESVAPQTDTDGCRREVWLAGGLSVSVYFRPDGVVADKGFVDFTMSPPSVFDRIRGWLGM